MISAHRWVPALLVAAASCASSHKPAPVPSDRGGVCRDCFWRYQPAGLEEELLAVYRAKRFADPLVDAQRLMLIATVTGDRASLCDARKAIARQRGSAALREPGRALLAAEMLAFTAASCGADPASAFRDAAAEAAAEPFKAEVYRQIAAGTFVPRFGDASIEKRIAPAAHARAFVLGRSKIVVYPGEPIGAQVERTVRDWLSYQLAWDGADRAVGKDALLPWHEGACLRRLIDAADVRVRPLTGALAVRHGDRWVAPDADGVFRFEVLDDKIQYPTTLVAGDVALLVDTHGISALVEPAHRSSVSLVVGCGDTEDKMKAAVTLAKSGVDVWFPCDRFAGDVVGYDAPGVLIGSAPVRRDGSRAVIGDRPVRFDVAETLVAEDYPGIGPLRYYDAPARYVRALKALMPLSVEYVAVDGAGQSSRVVRRAQELSASAIAIRVQTVEDAAPVRDWLAASRSHRAVLVHTAPYAPGYALFDEFPAQTTFADPRPAILE
jgi:hypothetical protein